MPRISKWDAKVTCGRSVPFTVSGECDGAVHVHGHAYPAGKDGPSGGEWNVDACPRCGFFEWSAEERAEMSEEARGARDA